MPSTSCPPLPGVTPATTWAPDAIIRRVCLVPSEPVMPLTRMRELSSKKIAMCGPRPSGGRRGQLGHPTGGSVHRVDELHAVQCGLVEDASTFLRVVAVEPDHQRLRDALALLLEERESGHDAVRDGVAGGDATEDVDEDRAHVGV